MPELSMGISDELQKVGVMQLIPVCLYFVAHAFQSELKKIYIYTVTKETVVMRG